MAEAIPSRVGKEPCYFFFVHDHTTPDVIKLAWECPEQRSPALVQAFRTFSLPRIELMASPSRPASSRMLAILMLKTSRRSKKPSWPATRLSRSPWSPGSRSWLILCVCSSSSVTLRMRRRGFERRSPLLRPPTEVSLPPSARRQAGRGPYPYDLKGPHV